MAAPINAKLKTAGIAKEFLQYVKLIVETEYKQDLRNAIVQMILFVLKIAPSMNI